MEFGWRRIWGLYGWKGLLSLNNRLFYFSMFIVAIAFILIKFSEGVIVPYDVIVNTVDLSISILPTLLGFNLGAYALIIGFLTSKNLIIALTKKGKDSGASRLEIISSVFAMNVITQAFSLLVAFMIKMSIDMNMSEIMTRYGYDHRYAENINLGILPIILFLTLYSVVLVIQNSINIFDFSQLFTYFETKKDDLKDLNDQVTKKPGE